MKATNPNETPRPGSLQRMVRRQPVCLWKVEQSAIEAVTKDAQDEANKTGTTQYVGGICVPEYGYVSLGFTDDLRFISGMGTVFATVPPNNESSEPGANKKG